MIKLSKFLENSKTVIMKEAQFITVKPFISFNKVIFYHRVLLHYNGVSDMHPIKL